MIHDTDIPRWLFRFFFTHAWMFRMGFFIGFLSLGAVAYRLRSLRAQAEPFIQRLQRVHYAGMFWTLFGTFVYHPYFTNLLIILTAIPLLVSYVSLAWWVIKEYGLGGFHDDSS